MSRIPKSLKQSFVATSLVALTALIPATGKLGNIFGGSTAHAQDSAEAATLPADFNKVPVSIPQPGAPAMTAYEKGAAAQDYSINNKGIGVFVNFAAVPELPPGQLIKAIEANFARKGISINLQTNVSRGDLTTVTFFVEGTPFAGEDGDGYTLGKVQTGFNTVVKAFEQQHAKKAATSELHSTIR